VRSCYNEGKRTEETFTMDYHRGAGAKEIKKKLSHGLNTRRMIDNEL
ncbi:unnamed protein product, partial [Urochloa humidicola]